MGLAHTVARLVGPLQGRQRYQTFFQKLNSLALQGMNYGRDRFDTNGELAVMRHVRESAGTNGDIVLFDVGANTGEYTAALLDAFAQTNAFVHSFEPSARTFEELWQRVQNRERVAIHKRGFSDTNSRRDLYEAEGLSGLSSVYPRLLVCT